MKRSIKFISVIAIIILLVVTLTGCTATKTSSKTTLTSDNSNNTAESSTTKTDKKYSVGEIYEDKNIAIKYVSLDDNFTGYNKYATVKSGCKVIKAEFEFENVGSSDQYVSSYEFNCYADGYDCDSFWSVEGSSFSSTLSKGKKAKGAIYFQVPTNATSITIEYETNVITNSKIEFVVK